MLYLISGKYGALVINYILMLQASIESIEQLTKQSDVNYTIVEEEDAFTYFSHMRMAEEMLYRLVCKH